MVRVTALEAFLFLCACAFASTPIFVCQPAQSVCRGRCNCHHSCELKVDAFRGNCSRGKRKGSGRSWRRSVCGTFTRGLNVDLYLEVPVSNVGRLISVLLDVFTTRGGTNRQPQLNLYQFCCLLCSSASVKSHHQAIKER
jgi:hypothetical protein